MGNRIDKKSAKTTTSALPDKLLNSKIHHLYKLEKVMSEDATGTIYAAGTKFKNRDISIYVLAPKCRILSRRLLSIDHPNICKVHRVMNLTDGTTAIIIERPPGKPIREFIEQDVATAGEFPVGQAISTILQLLSALHAIHLTGKTARNLSVNNLFLYTDKNSNLRLKLVSLGIGGTGINMKAPHYFSPERVMNIDKGDPRADIWAAGAIFFHLCFGRPPFGGADNYEVAKKNMLEEPDFNTGERVIPERLVQIIKRALHRDENQRYQTVSDMVGDLLPLREVFNEPMSEAVSKALKNSYPPPAPQSGMLAPQKPTTKNLPSLHPSGKAHKADRSDPTASYGTRKRTAGKKITGKKPDSKRAFLGKELPKKNAKEMPPRKPEVGPSQESTNRTLLGMPAITEEQVKQRISNTPLPKAALQPQAPHAQKAKKAVKGSEPLFKPRSILGSEEDIKQLEAEMGFLEEPEDDGDVPTLVATGQSFAAMVGRIAHLKDEELSEKESTKEPSEAVSTTQTIDDDVDIISVSTTVSEPPASQQENAAQPDAPRTQASPTAIGIAPASLPTAIGIAPVSLPTAIGTAPASPPSAVGTAPASPPSAIGTAPASPPSAIGTAPASPPSAVGTAPVSPSVAGTSPVSPVWGGGTAPASPTVQGFAPASTTSAFEPTPPTADVAPSSDSFTRKKKRNVLLFGAGATVVLVALVAIAVVSIFSEDTPAESAPEATAGTTSPTPSKSASAAVAVTPPAESAVTEVEVQSAELAEPAPADAEKATGAAETPAPEEKTEAFVSIGFNAVPKGATIKINGKTVQAPVKMAKTKKLAAVLITAEGYKTFRVRIVPDRDRQVPVKMKKLPPKSKNNKKKSAGKKSAGKKSKKSNSSLVSNPFTK